MAAKPLTRICQTSSARSYWHIVPFDGVNHVADERALCNYRPGYNSKGWVLTGGIMATCPACLRKSKAGDNA